MLSWRTCYYNVIILLVLLMRPAVRCLLYACTGDIWPSELMYYMDIMHNREWKKVTLIAIMDIEYDKWS